MDLYVDLVNRIAARRPSGVTLTMHMCRGNFRGKWLANGGYDYVADLAFSRLAVDAFLLEFDSPRAGSFAPLRQIPTDRAVVLGLVSTKAGGNESEDELLRRIDRASQFFPSAMMSLSPQCGFASHMLGNPLTAEDQERKLALVVSTAARAWGR
jgi:5-methyltetrahydropteroyltriglutamate--homocysteine methyltransferase